MSVGGKQPKEVHQAEPPAALLAEVYQIGFHSADLLRALLTRDENYIYRDIQRIRLSLNALESKLSLLGMPSDG